MRRKFSERRRNGRQRASRKVAVRERLDTGMMKLTHHGRSLEACFTTPWTSAYPLFAVLCHGVRSAARAPLRRGAANRWASGRRRAADRSGSIAEALVMSIEHERHEINERRGRYGKGPGGGWSMATFCGVPKLELDHPMIRRGCAEPFDVWRSKW